MNFRLLHRPVVIALLLSLLGSALNVTPAGAASFSVSNATELVNAINTANANGTADTITLTSNITLIAVNNITTGENGLPIIQPDGGNALTIDGNGYTLARSSAVGIPNFRFIEVANGANLTLQNITLFNGSPLGDYGGAVYNNISGTLGIINSTFNGNSSVCDPGNPICYVDGGAVYSIGALSITNSIFLNNKTDNDGGAVYPLGNTTITNSVFFQNRASLRGGGIMNRGSLLITNSTISENSAGTNGGGIYNISYPGSFIIANSTITENSAANDGGGLYLRDGTTTSINNTFSDNGSVNGGNIYNIGGGYATTLELKNTIVSTTIFFQSNCAGAGTTIAGPDNLATDTTCGSATPVTSTMLKLSPTLADNGGPTQTLALLHGSAAIDAGNATTCAAAPVSGKDQRGVTRPFGTGCDVGAFEYDGSVPTVTITPVSYTVDEQTALNLHGTGISVDDLNGDPLTVTIAAADANAKLTASVGTTGAVIASGNGTNTLQLTGTIAQLNDFFAGNSGGALTFLLDDDTPVSSLILTITANDGVHSGNDTATINIAPVNDPPVNSVPGGQTINEDTALVFSAGNGNAISISDVDAGSGNLEGTLSVTNGILTLAGTTGLSFTTGDGTADSTLVFTGSLTNINSALAALTFNPTTNYNGAAVLSITTSDMGNTGAGGTLTAADTVNITINAANDLPVVANPIPNQNATEDSAFSYMFPANVFSDLDVGDVFTYTAQRAGGGALSAWLTFNSATRTFSGTPSNADVGIITLEVTADDGFGGTAKDNFDLVVMNVNDPPVVVVPIPNQTVAENTVFNFTFAANTFSDPDAGDTLSYSAQLAGGGLLPAWVSFDSATRTLSGTPLNVHIGTVSIDVIASDGNGGSVTDTFDITVTSANSNPYLVNPIPNQNATEDLAFTYAFPSNTFGDPDIGTTLTYTAQLADGSALPAWLSFDAATRTFSGTPSNSDVGLVTIKVTADDGTGGTISDNFDLQVVNSNDVPVVFIPIPDQSAAENVAFNYQFPSNTFSDPDVGDVLVYSAQRAGGGALPAWLSFDAATRTFSGTPLASAAGVYGIDVTADDGNGGTVTDTFTITVNSISPFITSVNTTNPDGTYIIGDMISVTVAFDQIVNVDTSGGLPTILLETGATDRRAEYFSGSGTNTLTFRYIVQTGDVTPDLDYQTTTALALNGGTILSVGVNPAILTLPVPGGANSIAGQHNIVIDGTTFGVFVTSLLPTYTTGPSTFTITFDDEANDPAGDTNPDDVTNPSNYLLVEDGANGTFDTTSCLGGRVSDDTQISVASVSYLSKTAVVVLASPPTNGTYRLFVCGTTSIVNLAGNPIAGDGVTSGTDYIFDFVVAATTTTPTDTENPRASFLPSTGFAPNKITSLPAQPATSEYAELGDLWLEIPSLNVKTSIVGVPQTNGEWDVTWLGDDAGWLNGTAFPTWNGNSVLTAHVTNASGLEGPFAALKSLQYGDQIIVHMGGVKYVYEIQTSRMVRPYSTSFAFESLQDHSYLTLITCQEYIPQNETYRFRRVVRAVLVSVENE